MRLYNLAARTLGEELCPICCVRSRMQEALSILEKEQADRSPPPIRRPHSQYATFLCKLLHFPQVLKNIYNPVLICIAISVSVMYNKTDTQKGPVSVCNPENDYNFSHSRKGDELHA